jgi:hypothetical protein
LFLYRLFNELCSLLNGLKDVVDKLLCKGPPYTKFFGGITNILSRFFLGLIDMFFSV